MEALRKLVITAVNILQKQFEISFSCKNQVDLYNTLGWKNSGNEQYFCNEQTVPIFEVDLILKTGKT